MYVRRDYSQSMFGAKRKRGGRRTFIAVLIILLIAIGIAYLERDQISQIAMEAMGVVPEPTMMPNELASAAVALYRQGDTARARAMFEQAIAARPDNIDYVYEYGLMLIEMGNYDRALEIAEQTILENPYDPRGFTLKARAQVWSGNSASAVTTALAGMEVDRQFSPLHSVLARAYIGIGDFRSALESGQLAVEYDPLNADAYRSYSYALNNAAAYEEAIAQLEIAVSLDPQNTEALMELAGYYLWSDRDQEAIDIYTSILSAQSRNARAMLRLCDAYRKIGQFDVAMGHCQDAADTDPTYNPAQFRYGLLLYSDRDFAGAKRYFEQCVKNQPDSLECLYRLGLTDYYLYLGVTAQANLLQDEQQRNELLAQGPAYCESAWNHLQESLNIAESSAIGGETLENIRLGLGYVARDCPAYRGAATLPDELLIVPEETAIPDVPLELTPVSDPNDQGA